MIQFRRDCMDYLSILVRSAFSFIYLLILSKMTGKRQISQMTFYDYTTAVTIGSIAAVAGKRCFFIMRSLLCVYMCAYTVLPGNSGGPQSPVSFHIYRQILSELRMGQAVT